MSNTSSRRNSTNVKSSAPAFDKDNSGHQKTNDSCHANSSVMTLPDAKWIHIYINGDEHFAGCRCVVNSRYYRNLDMFLNYLTERLKPSFGAVRNIYTPVNGHPVLRLEDLISKQKYVVAGNERFKKLEFGYTDGDKKIKRNGLKPKNKFKISKAKPLCHNTLTVYVYENGNFKAKPNKMSLLPEDLESWELVFQKAQEAIKCGPIKRLCSLNGKSIQNIEELVNNQSYVIVGKHEVFKLGHYGNSLSYSSSRGKYLAHRSSRKSSSVITARSSAVYSQASARSSKFGFTFSASKNKQKQYHDNSAYNSLNIAEPGNGVDSLDSFNQHKVQLLEENDFNGNKIRIDLDDDVSGVFRSKTQNHLTAGAVEIEDSLETVVDIPVDLLDAEEVEDEITPDMERSLQHLSLDVPEELVAYLPTMQNKQNSGERQVSTNKYNMNHSQTIDVHNIFV